MRADNERKKLLLILLLIGGFVVLVFLLTRTVPAILYTDSQIKSTLDYSTVLIPESEVSVSLNNGIAEYEDSEIEGTVEVTDPYLSVKTNEGYDLFATMTYTTGGVGEFVTLAIFEEEDGEVIFRNSFPIGDRVIVKDIIGPESPQQGAYRVIVEYLDHEFNQSLTESPKIQKRLELEIEDHSITTNLSE